MTKDKNLKRLIRARATRTGESYTAARRTVLAKGSKPEPKTQELWFLRRNHGYSGKGKGKPIGFEHVTITTTGRGIKVRMDGAISSYGIHEHMIESDGVSRRSHFDLGRGRTVIDSRVEGSVWMCAVEHDRDTEEVSLDARAPRDEIVPSVAARFLPVMLPRDIGELASYVPVPEDAFPMWRPPGKASFFPLMGASRELLVEQRVIVGRGEETMGKGKNAVCAFRYDHINTDGVDRGTTWVDDDGRVVAFERLGLILRAISEDDAKRLDPRGTTKGAKR